MNNELEKVWRKRPPPKARGRIEVCCGPLSFNTLATEPILLRGFAGTKLKSLVFRFDFRNL
jgi:hypothetical protein